MATSSVAGSHVSTVHSAQVDWPGLVLSAVVPLVAFVVANGVAQQFDILPLFFSPIALPGWVGAALHLSALPMFGIARWIVVRHGAPGRHAGWWLVALMAGMVSFPFMVMPLDSLMLSLVSMTLLIVGLGTMVRVAAIDTRAALLMAPGMAWMGFSAFVGLSFAAAWAPPFAVTNSQAAA